jgi:hypothetical protein
MQSTTKVWAAISNMFASASRMKVQHLRAALIDTKKLNMTADEYFNKMKGFASELVAAGKPLEDDELIGIYFMVLMVLTPHLSLLSMEIQTPPLMTFSVSCVHMTCVLVLLRIQAMARSPLL